MEQCGKVTSEAICHNQFLYICDIFQSPLMNKARCQLEFHQRIKRKAWIPL